MQKRIGGRNTKPSKTGKRAVLGLREKRRLIQLGLCVGLFLVVFLGKGAAPAGVVNFGETLLQTIRSNTDFKSAFSSFGEAVSQGDPMLETLEKLAVEVFGAGEQGRENASNSTWLKEPAVQAAVAALAQRPTSETVLAQIGASAAAAEAGGKSDTEQEPGPAPSPAIEIPEYTGPALPDGATMEYFDLGLSETVTPVMGRLTSPYGYRDHPVSGEYSFHTGLDLAADIGTPVLAFADGTVDFVGESEAYGLYIQLDHGNGVKTFYCHCSALYAPKGASVTVGQTIAAVGDTGNATGPHLHLEIKRDGVLLNPSYYVETAD